MKNNLQITRLALFLVLSLLLVTSAFAQSSAVSAKFEQIRNNEALLQSFFSQMPKGGDLHNHLTGSVYAETYFKVGCDKGLWIDTLTCKLYSNSAANRLQLTPAMNNLHKWRVKCIDNWSVRNFEKGKSTLPPDEFFFSTFGVFGAAATSEQLSVFLAELMKRASAENVSYLEVMATSPNVDTFQDTRGFNQAMKTAIENEDAAALDKLLVEFCDSFEKKTTIGQQAAIDYVKLINKLYESIKGVAPDVEVCFQSYAGRNSEPFKVFAQLYVGFMATKINQTGRLRGVNIVQAENGELSMRDYWGHMRMFKFLKEKTANQIPAAIHAGELTLGLVPPEDLSFHISDAVSVAGAKRIGHGVDMPFESDAKGILKNMKDNNVAIEINLTSNEFILGVKEDAHPIMMYKQANVPIVLATDDPGILRTNLTQQFVIAAMRYPELKYADFYKFINNSVDYSFAPQAMKNKLKAELKDDLDNFEKTVLM